MTKPRKKRKPRKDLGPASGPLAGISGVHTPDRVADPVPSYIEHDRQDLYREVRRRYIYRRDGIDRIAADYPDTVLTREEARNWRRMGGWYRLKREQREDEELAVLEMRARQEVEDRVRASERERLRRERQEAFEEAMREAPGCVVVVDNPAPPVLPLGACGEDVEALLGAPTPVAENVVRLTGPAPGEAEGRARNTAGAEDGVEQLKALHVARTASALPEPAPAAGFLPPAPAPPPPPLLALPSQDSLLEHLRESRQRTGVMGRLLALQLQNLADRAKVFQDLREAAIRDGTPLPHIEDHLPVEALPFLARANREVDEQVMQQESTLRKAAILQAALRAAPIREVAATVLGGPGSGMVPPSTTGVGALRRAAALDGSDEDEAPAVAEP